MTVSSTNRKAGPYSGNGVTTAFPFAFKVFQAADLYVVRTDSAGIESVLTLTTDYTVSLNADQNANPGGTVTLVTALASGYTLTLTSNLAYLQATDLTNQGGFYPAVITNALDRLTIFCQQLYEQVGRALKLPISSTGVNPTLPTPKANNLVGWNTNADGFQNVDPATLATLVAYGTAKADLFSGNGSTTAFTLTANPGAQANLDVSLNGVAQRPGIDYTWSGGLQVTFTAAPPTGVNNLLIRYMQGLPSGYNSNPSEVASVSVLRATTPSYAYQQFYLLGYASAGKGGGLVYYDPTDTTTADNNVTVFVNGSYRFKRIFDGSVNPWMAGADGTAVNDTTAITRCVNYLKTLNKGVLVVPADINNSATIPALALSANQSLTVMDQRLGVSGRFGAVAQYTEARDAGGGYATEYRIQGMQNPSLVLEPKSNGTAPGYPRANNGAGVVGLTNGGLNNVQMLFDPFFNGYVGDWAMLQYAAGNTSVSFSMYGGVDANNKTRIDVTPINLASSTINISSVTNTSPIVVNLASPHNIVATRSPVSIAGVGTGVNGSWMASITGPSQLTLLGSTASGAFGAVGTATVQPNAQRATFNVPAVQGGVEAICGEGTVVATGTNGKFLSEVPTGTAPFQASSTTVDANLHAKPAVYNISGVQQTNTKIHRGFVNLVGGTLTYTLPAGVTFTSASSFNTSVANHTAIRDVQVVHNSGSSVTFNGTGTDLIGFIMIGS